MKLLSVVFFFIGLFARSQQTYELCNDQTITSTFYATYTGDGTNSWDVNGTYYFTDELTYTFNEPGVYNITLRRDNELCYAEESIQINILKCPGVIYWIPNCFTPDGDEANQLFGPIMSDGYDSEDFSFVILNRWGEIIWESHDPNAKWDGTYGGLKCTDGVYVWKLQFNVLGNDDRILDTGHVTLLR